MSTLSSDEVKRRCQDLVYQVAYAFYDAPYIILLRLMVELGVATEKRLADICQVTPGELRKYMGMLLVHRLVRRHVGKEKIPLDPRRPPFGNPNMAGKGVVVDGEERFRTKEVIYWYLDYREFANVVKYRLAMMRKAIDDKVKSEVGVRGYICPNCGRSYTPLDLPSLFDPFSNTFLCETCKTEVTEHDPGQDAPDGQIGGQQDRMGQFNLATAPIRDALKSLEGANMPSINIVAWMAQHVKVDAGAEAGEGMEDEAKKFTVVIGLDGERERLEAERTAEAAKAQTSLPVWYTNSTITGQSTSLGLAAERKVSLPKVEQENKADADEDDLEEHYASLVGPSSSSQQYEEGVLEPSAPKVEFAGTPADDEDDEDEMDEFDSSVPVSGADTPVVPDGESKMIFVGGVAKPLADVTEEDEGLMTPEEYQAYYEAMS